MANHFARFGFEPRPWLDEEILKTRYLELSAQTHPDKSSVDNRPASESDFKALNEAFNTLRNTRSRLLHLLEIGGLAKHEHVQNVPPDALEFFTIIARTTQDTDTLLKEKAAANSPMLKVQLMDRTLEQIDAMQSLQEKLRQKIAAIEEWLKGVSVEWQQEPDGETIALLAQSAAALGFLEKWHAQLQERIAALTF